MEYTDGAYSTAPNIAPWDMHLQTSGTSNKPLAGAVLCCTSIAPEQRVRQLPSLLCTLV
jgi:hypothetical protein